MPRPFRIVEQSQFLSRGMLRTLFAIVVVCLPAETVAGQPLPDGDPFAEQTFNPTVEVLVAVGNGAMATYNGYMTYLGRRRQFAAGLGIVLGAVGIAIGLREEANYPTVDLAMGAISVAAAGANMLLYRSQSGIPIPLPGAASMSAFATSAGATLKLRVDLEPRRLNHRQSPSF